jgi:hypothetical protein
MGFDSQVNTGKLVINGPGGISSDFGNIASDGINGNLLIGLLQMLQQTSAATVVATSGTIAVPATSGAIRVAPGGAVTSVVLAAGPAAQCQILIIWNEAAAANTITFAAAGTSNVAGGTSVSLAGLSCHIMVWNWKTALWYQVGPLTN